MGLLDIFSSKPKENPQEQSKLLSENQQTLAGMEALAKRVSMSAQEGPPQGLSMEEYLARLRREGSGR